ncbi:oxidoreductase [Mycobacterium alsense]|uniref:oxidoreductase n=1 Tax=Mycobacterium alsense TaxID=324058 RepID=UPI0008024752|nr:oxidoreductase [Mycobacterium alsense]OBI95054.1 oxidoreductase [Mycobacterium alsense]
MAGLLVRLTHKAWRGIFSSPLLTLNGYVAFDVPRAVTGLGASLLMGIVAVHVYLLVTEPDLPVYFVIYAAALIAAWLVACGAMVFAFKPTVPQRGWYFGSLTCTVFLVIYLVSRFVSLPGLVALTGRWDLAPGSMAMALAAGFLAVHTTVLSGINVAYPQRQNWHD